MPKRVAKNNSTNWISTCSRLLLPEERQNQSHKVEGLLRNYTNAVQSLLIAVKDRIKSRAKPDHIHRNKYILQETTSSLHKMSKELEAQQEAHSSVPRFGLIDH